MAVIGEKYGIGGFLGAVKASGGMATSNMYAVEFKNIGANLKKRLEEPGFQSFSEGTAYEMLTLLCEEASLPGMMANSGQTTGVFMGEGQVNYAHTKSYTDITLGWTCDANMLPVKFVNAWLGFIFGDQDPTTKTNNGNLRINRVQYPDDYQCEIVITKAERNGSSALGRVSGIYTLYDAWPYSIQATPLSYGATSLLKVSASFYFRRWDFEYRNINNSK
jgi:hypothetical protein